MNLKAIAIVIGLASLIRTEVASAQLRRTAPPPAGSVEVALADLALGKPLPGLPDLYKPVYLAPWSIACNTLGELGNPNIGVLLEIHACGIDTKPNQVLVIPPRDAQGYVNGHVFGVVWVQLLLPKGESDGSIEMRWVYIEDLSNDPKKWVLNTGVKSEMGVAAPENSSGNAVARGVSDLSEAEFKRQFRCPETYGNSQESKQGLIESLEWYGAHNVSVTEESFKAFRRKLFVEHKCSVTLKNLQINQQ